MKRLLPKLIFVLLALFISVGSSVAYLTSTDADVNVMTLGQVKIRLNEQERLPDGTLTGFQDGHPLYPAVYTDELGTDADGYWTDVQNALDKIVTVKNTGKSDAYVRVWFAFECVDETFFTDKLLLNRNEADWDWSFSRTADGAYELITLEGTKYVTAVATLPQALPSQEITPVSLRQVLLDSGVTNEDVAALGDEYTILVVAQAAQVQGFPDAATALNAAFGDEQPFADMPEDTEEVAYFATLSDALSGLGGSSDSAGASFSLSLQEGHKHISLLSDAQTDGVTLSQDVTLHLNGHTLHCTSASGLEITAGSTVIDGSAPGSALTADGRIAAVNGGRLEVKGGAYTASTAGAGTPSAPFGAFTVAQGATAQFSSAAITANDSGKGTTTGILGAQDSTIIAEDCTIEAASSGSLETAGVRSSGDVRLTRCSVIGKSDYTANAAGTNYATNCRGVYSDGSLEMYDCYVWGAHAGVTTKGELFVDGGTYEGYGHGGLYCANAGKTVHICNASINWAEMLPGCTADNVAGTNGAGMYVGGASNITLCMDSCQIYGTLYGVVLRGSGREANNILNISNSSMEFGRYSVRISSGTSGVNIGTGNNFTAGTTSAPGRCTATNESYAAK